MEDCKNLERLKNLIHDYSIWLRETKSDAGASISFFKQKGNTHHDYSGKRICDYVAYTLYDEENKT